MLYMHRLHQDLTSHYIRYNLLLTQESNEPITWQQDDLLNFKESIRKGKNGDVAWLSVPDRLVSWVLKPQFCCWPCSLIYAFSNNPACHKAQIISVCFCEHVNELTLQNWPPQSPDFNLREHLWDVKPTNLQQMCDAIMSIWSKTSAECFQHLDEFMSWWIRAVLEAKQGPTQC